MGRNTVSNDYPVHLEGTDELLFTLELRGPPHMGRQIPYMPLTGPAVVYKVEDLKWVTAEKSFVPPDPPGGTTEFYTSTIVKVIVSVVP